jgi:Helix-turn-helix domain
MSKIKEREQAIVLRNAGSSISEIARKLKVSKSTISLWCRDISLSKEAQELIVYKSKHKSTAGILRYTEGLRQKRILETEVDFRKGATSIGTLTRRELLLVGLGLYWGEGYKHGSQEFGFTNSDPLMIVFYIHWLSVCFGIDRADLIARVSINESHEARVLDVESFWSKVTGVPLHQFTKTSLIRSASKKVYKNTSEHFGTLRIKVRRGTRLRRQVLGAIRQLSKVRVNVKS